MWKKFERGLKHTSNPNAIKIGTEQLTRKHTINCTAMKCVLLTAPPRKPREPSNMNTLGETDLGYHINAMGINVISILAITCTTVSASAIYAAMVMYEPTMSESTMTTQAETPRKPLNMNTSSETDIVYHINAMGINAIRTLAITYTTVSASATTTAMIMHEPIASESVRTARMRKPREPPNLDTSGGTDIGYHINAMGTNVISTLAITYTTVSASAITTAMVMYEPIMGESTMITRVKTPRKPPNMNTSGETDIV